MVLRVITPITFNHFNLILAKARVDAMVCLRAPNWGHRNTMVIEMVEYISYEVKDRSLAYGSLEGDVPFAGTFRDGDVDREIRGGLQWNTRLPDSNPEEGMLNVSMIMFVDNIDIGPSPCGRMRLESDLVSRLNANRAEAGEELLSMLLEKTGNVGRFNVRPVY